MVETKEKLLLVGAGGLGRVVLEHVCQKYECAFIDDADITSVDGIPVIGKISEISAFYPEYKLLVVTIGDNVLREQVYKNAFKIGYEFPSIIHSSAYVSPHARFGFGCIILNNAVLQNNAKCGNGCIINPGVELHHDASVGDFCLIYTNSVIRSLTHIGNRVWIGSTVTVSTGASLPDDSITKDGTVVHKS